MTIAQIEGGLASQMFGYAAARRLALRYGAKVFIDSRNYRQYKKFEPELQHLNVDAHFLTDDEADEAVGTLVVKIPVVRPAHLHFDRAITDLPTPHVLMVGNYVSADYFDDIEEVLRKDFRRTSQPAPYALEVAEHLRELEERGFTPVAVHVRRGDYVDEVDVNQAHGTCTDDYYRNAFALMERTIERPWFVFFSNDPSWVDAKWSGENRTITQPPADTPPVEDMMLMAACRHHIIANSCYSWWAAWLGKNDEQVVIGPRPFMANRALNTDDILLREWIGLGSIPRTTDS